MILIHSFNLILFVDPHLGVFFIVFFNFVMQPNWWSSTRWISQIWLQAREQSKKSLQSWYSLATCWNLVRWFQNLSSKSETFAKKYSQKSFILVALDLSVGTKWRKSTGKERWSPLSLTIWATTPQPFSFNQNWNQHKMYCFHAKCFTKNLTLL